MSLIFILVLIGIGITITSIAVAKEKKNTEAIKELAGSIGFTFNPNPQPGDYPIESFKLFGIGHSKHFRNGMTQEKNGVKISQFEYAYTVGSGKNKSTYRQTVTLFQTSRLKLPQFILKPENIFHKIGELFGSKDIDFLDSPGFSKKYLLKSCLENETKEIFSKEIRDAFEHKPNYYVEGHTDLLLFHTSKKIQAECIIEAFEERVGLFQLFLKQAK